MTTVLANTLEFKPLNNLMNWLLGHYVTIYMIHRPPPADGSFAGLSPALLEQCLAHAQEKGYQFASIDEIVQLARDGKKPSRPTLCFTIDDGYLDQVSQLVPVLLKYEAKPTLFVITDLIDHKDWAWDAKIAHMAWNTAKDSATVIHNSHAFQLQFSTLKARRESRRILIRYAKKLTTDELDDFLICAATQLDVIPPVQAPETYHPASWQDLRNVEQRGLRIGSHACSHRIFSSLSLPQVKHELLIACERIRNELANPSSVFCYPSGTVADFSESHVELVEQQGYLGAVTSIPGNTDLKDIQKNAFMINRHSFPNTLEKFIRYSSWFEVIRSKLG